MRHAMDYQKAPTQAAANPRKGPRPSRRESSGECLWDVFKKHLCGTAIKMPLGMSTTHTGVPGFESQHRF